MAKKIRLILFILLSLVWTAYWGWSLFAETGLAAVVARLQLQYFGAFYETPTVFGGWIAGMMVALIVAPKTGTGGVDFALAPDTTSPVEKSRRMAKWSLIGGLVGGAVFAGGFYAYGTTLPDGTEAPVKLNLGRYDARALPLGQRVILLGDRPDFGAIVTETGQGEDMDTYYQPVVATGADPLAAPVQFFQVARLRSGGTPADSLFEMDGYLSETPLELIARDVLAEQGMAVAETTYQVRATGDAPQFQMFVAAGISAVFGGILMLIGGVSLLLGRRKV